MINKYLKYIQEANTYNEVDKVEEKVNEMFNWALNFFRDDLNIQIGSQMKKDKEIFTPIKQYNTLYDKYAIYVDTNYTNGNKENRKKFYKKYKNIIDKNIDIRTKKLKKILPKIRKLRPDIKFSDNEIIEAYLLTKWFTGVLSDNDYGYQFEITNKITNEYDHLLYNY